MPPQTRHLRLCAFVLSHAWLVGRVIGSAGILPPSRSLTAEGAEKRLASLCGGTQSDTRLPVHVRRKCSVTTAFFVPVSSSFFCCCFFVFGAEHDNRARSLLHLLPRAPSPHYLVLHDSCFSFDCFVNPSFCATPPTATAAARVLLIFCHNCAVLPLCSNDRKLPQGNICLLGKF